MTSALLSLTCGASPPVSVLIDLFTEPRVTHASCLACRTSIDFDTQVGGVNRGSAGSLEGGAAALFRSVPFPFPLAALMPIVEGWVQGGRSQWEESFEAKFYVCSSHS